MNYNETIKFNLEVDAGEDFSDYQTARLIVDLYDSNGQSNIDEAYGLLPYLPQYQKWLSADMTYCQMIEKIRESI
jgi:hypothetical protein